MGLRGPTPKPEDRRQRRNQPRRTPLPRSSVRPLPTAPSGLLVLTRERWRRYWASPVSRLAETTDYPAVERLFRLSDERERAARRVRRAGPLVRGSQGQPVLNPLVRYLAQCDVELRALEDRFGLNARARLQLGLEVGGAKRSVEDLNRELTQSVTDDGDDPRLSTHSA